MVIVLKKQKLFLGLFAAGAVFCICVFLYQTPVLPALSTAQLPAFNIILDAGHGGEDGGAVSPDGVRESDLNLQIAYRAEMLLRFCGQHTQMTRTQDTALDNGEKTIRKRKTADLKARAALVAQTPNAVLISIHQNSLPQSPATHGAQVFWNPEPGARELASFLQESLNSLINSDRPKQTRQIPDTVYVMKHCAAPAVLLECGFLSNQEETQRLQTKNHQQKLALSITAGFLRWRAGEELQQ